MHVNSLSPSASEGRNMHAWGHTQRVPSADVLRLCTPSISIYRSSLQDHLSPLVQYLQVCTNHIDLLSDSMVSSSSKALHAIPLGDIPHDMAFPFGTLNAGKEIFYPETDISCHNLGFCVNSPLKWFNSSPSIAHGSSRVKPYVHTLDESNTNAISSFGKALHPLENDLRMKDHVVPLIEYPAPAIEEESANMPKNGENVILNQVSMIHHSDGDCNHAAEPLPKITISSAEIRARCRTSDRLRRARISEGIKALRNTVPCLDKGSQESVMDDAIDYIKYLKLQLQILSQSRLSGEAATYPFVYLEGYGHYLLDPHASNEPLEEMMGQLMESNREGASDLLMRKGLAILPMDLAYTLLQTN